MIFFDAQMLEDYGKNDRILALMRQAALPGDEGYVSHRWLLESMPKRMIFEKMYEGLFTREKNRPTVLDVGGGFSSLSRLFLETGDYRLLDIMAHDSPAQLARLETAAKRPFWIRRDWNDYAPGETFDIVIANDLFPNVDQRLEFFIESYLPVCRWMRLSLTYYNSPRWYKVKRTDGDEIFHMLAWDGAQVERVLAKYADRLAGPDFSGFHRDRESLFANKRQVCMAVLKGGA